MQSTLPLPSTDRHRRQYPRAHMLFEDGVVAVGLGLVLLVAPALFDNFTVMRAMAVGFRLPGCLALGVGLSMLGYFVAFKRNVVPMSAAPAPPGKGRFRPSTPAVARPAPPMPWGPAVFRAIEWRRFNAVCEALFAQAGFVTVAKSRGASSSADVWLYSRNANGPVSVVRCKQSLGRAVELRELHKLHAVMETHHLARGTFVTTSILMPDALQFAKAHGIHVLEGPSLLALIARRTPAQQQDLLNVAFEGDYARPTCARCGTKMQKQIPATGGAPFWSCSNKPRCPNRLPMVVD